MTDSEVVKALRSWLEEIRKARQAYLEKVNEEHYPSMRYEYLLSDTIHEINRLQAENERLQNILICFMGALGKVRKLDDIDEISLIPLMSELNKQYRAEIKAEAVKEFAERLKNEFQLEQNYEKAVNFTITLFRNTIDNLLKELGDNSESTN